MNDLRRQAVTLAIGLFSVGVACNCGQNQNCPQTTFSSLNTNLFSVTCTLSSCHNSMATSSVGNLDLQTNAYQALLGANGQGVKAVDPVGYSYTYNSMLLVKPGDPSNSLMYLKMTQDPNTAATGCPQSQCKYGELMPYASSPLPQCYLDAIKTWITNGAQNN